MNFSRVVWKSFNLLAPVVVALALVHQPAPSYQMDPETVEYLKQECPNYDGDKMSIDDRLCIEYAGRALTAQRNASY